MYQGSNQTTTGAKLANDANVNKKKRQRFGERVGTYSCLRWCFQISFLWSLSIIIFKTGKLIRIFYRIDVNGINEFSKLSKFTVTKKRFLYFPLQLAEHSNCFLRRCVGASRPLSQPFWLAHPWCSQNLMSAYPLVTFVPHLHLVSGCFPVFTKVSLPKKNWTPPNFRIHLRSNLKDSV